MFPNGGSAVQPRALTRVIDQDGGVASTIPRARIASSPRPVAFQMVSMLEDVIDRGTGSPARTAYGMRFPVGGKTGTTDDFKDAWFVGFTSSIVAGVWVGLDQPATIGRNGYGARYALPIWSDFMRGRVTQAAGRAISSRLRACGKNRCARCRTCGRSRSADLHRVLQGRRRVPTRLCPIHQGTVKQRIRRAVEGFFSGLGRKLKGSSSSQRWMRADPPLANAAHLLQRRHRRVARERRQQRAVRPAEPHRLARATRR